MVTVFNKIKKFLHYVLPISGFFLSVVFFESPKQNVVVRLYKKYVNLHFIAILESFLAFSGLYFHPLAIISPYSAFSSSMNFLTSSVVGSSSEQE